MDVKQFTGDFYEIGEQLGSIYKHNLMNFDKLKIDQNLFKNQLKVYKKYYPELLEEFKGMARGGDFNVDRLIYKFITSELYYYRKAFALDKACTIFGYRANDKLIVGRNYDWIPETEKIFEVYKINNQERNSFIGITDMGIDNSLINSPQYYFYNADDLINDKGLFIGITFANADEWSYGISCIHMTKIIGETCETVKDALNVFEKIPLCCPKNFFIADKYGEMAIVEHTSKKFKVLYPKDNILIQTNHYIDPDLAKEDTVLQRFPDHNTFKRLGETLDGIKRNQDNFSINTTIKILGKPGSYTCQNLPSIKTIWTLSLDMIEQKYKIYWNILEDRKQFNLEF